MVLTGAAFHHKYYSYLYSYTMPQEIRSVPCHAFIFIFLYFFGELECVGHSFAYVAYFVFLRDVWIRTQRVAVDSKRKQLSCGRSDIHMLGAEMTSFELTDRVR
jgi:hypothetical protein